jgi:hypothetical protein
MAEGEDQSPHWTLRHRVEAWNLIYSVAQHLRREQRQNPTLSPFATTAFQYLAKFYTSRDPSGRFIDPDPEMDLFLMVLSAVFVTLKAEGISHDPKMDDTIWLLFAAVDRFSEASKLILGRSSTAVALPKSGERRPDDLNYHRFRADMKRAELYFLTGIEWAFITEYPFVLFNELLGRIRKRLREDQLDGFREMRAIAVHYMIVIIVVLDQDVPHLTMSGAAITRALRAVPVRELGMNEANWGYIVKKKRDVDIDWEAVAALAAMIDALEAKLAPFAPVEATQT